MGGQQVLDCVLRYPGDQTMQFILYWRKDGIKDPILIKYDGYSAQVRLSLHPGVCLSVCLSVVCLSVCLCLDQWSMGVEE